MDRNLEVYKKLFDLIQWQSHSSLIRTCSRRCPLAVHGSHIGIGFSSALLLTVSLVAPLIGGEESEWRGHRSGWDFSHIL